MRNPPINIGDIRGGYQLLERLPGGKRVIVRCLGCEDHRTITRQAFYMNLGGCPTCGRKTAEPKKATSFTPGEQVHDWVVVQYCYSRSKWEVLCSCGKTMYKVASDLRKDQRCADCSRELRRKK